MGFSVGDAATSAAWGGFAGAITAPRLQLSNKGFGVQAGGMAATGLAAYTIASQFESDTAKMAAGVTTGVVGGAGAFIGAALLSSGNKGKGVLALTGVVGGLLGAMGGMLAGVQAQKG